MLTTNIKEIYDVILADRKHVLIFVGVDLDGLISVDMLITAFKAVDLPHSVIRTTAREDVTKYVQKEFFNIQEPRNMIFVNCGGNIPWPDVAHEIGVPAYCKFYIIDSHRPLDIDMLYNEHMILLISPNENDHYDIPEPQDVQPFEEPDPNEELSYKDEQELDIRRRVYQENLDRILLQYYAFEFKIRPSTSFLYELLKKLSLTTSAHGWMLIVAWQHMYEDGVISKAALNNAIELQTIRQSISRHSILSAARLKGGNILSAHVPNARNANGDCDVEFTTDLNAPFYRHTTVYEALHISPLFEIMRLYTNEGCNKLNLFLARAGLALIDCRRLFNTTTTDFRREFVSVMREAFEMQQMSNKVMDLMMPKVFKLVTAYAHTLLASDCARALQTLVAIDPRLLAGDSNNLKMSAETIDPVVLLRQVSSTPMQQAIERAARFQKIIHNEVSAVMHARDMRIFAARFQYLNHVPASNHSVYQTEYGMTQFGRLLMRTYSKTASYRNNKKNRLKPLLITIAVEPSTSSVGQDLEVGFSYVCAIPPVEAEAEMIIRSILPRALELATRQLGIESHYDFLNRHIIRIRTEDIARLLDAVAYTIDGPDGE